MLSFLSHIVSAIFHAFWRDIFPCIIQQAFTDGLPSKPLQQCFIHVGFLTQVKPFQTVDCDKPNYLQTEAFFVPSFNALMAATFSFTDDAFLFDMSTLAM
ncbi:Fluoride-specific ion channel FluC [Trichinella spiralis]|uniref:Fluoride-specific ion channel FluC n=1 Tax=Trichinella spiralis TaxID=6334 RepID=A0ABR3K3E7_TRISP